VHAETVTEKLTRLGLYLLMIVPPAVAAGALIAFAGR
jgi:hypothetical protein